MLSGDLDLIRRHAELIRSPDVLEAYRYLVGHAALLPTYRCEARQKGEVADFRYYEGDEQSFAFIVNQQSLLWYFRTPGLRNAAADPVTLKGSFAHVRENARGEITARLSTLSDTVRLARMVFDTARVA
jgi:hypothetical protein